MLLAQRVCGMALGYEDIIDHDTLRFDPALKLLASPRTGDPGTPAPLAGKSTLNRLEQSWETGNRRYHQMVPNLRKLSNLFVTLSLDAHQMLIGAEIRPPRIKESQRVSEPIGVEPTRRNNICPTCGSAVYSTNSAIGRSGLPARLQPRRSERDHPGPHRLCQPRRRLGSPRPRSAGLPEMP